MAGDENSTDIMEGVNQIVTAINDVILSSACTPQVNVTCDGTGGGTQGPSEGGTEGDPPPDGWSDPPDLPGTPEYDTRKCKMANAIHESLIDWLTLWETHQVDGYTSAFLTIALISLLGALVGEISTPVPLIDGVIGLVIGFLSGIAIAVINGGFSLSTILGLMATHEQSLVCALYNSTTTQDGIDDYIQVLIDNGASAGDVILLESVIMIDLLNNLFFKKGDAIDAALASYTAPLSCVSCAVCPEISLSWGTWDPGLSRATSEWSPAHGRDNLVLYFNASDFIPTYCGSSVTLDSLVEISGTPDGTEGYKIYNQAGTLIYTHANAPPPAPLALVGRFTCISYSGTFVIEVNWS